MLLHPGTIGPTRGTTEFQPGSSRSNLSADRVCREINVRARLVRTIPRPEKRSRAATNYEKVAPSLMTVNPAP